MQNLNEYKKIIDIELNNITNNIKIKELKNSIQYIIKSKGKRIRSVLCLMLSNIFKIKNINIINYATAIELFHNALLIYDDIIDKSNTRRNKITLHKKWNYSRAILSSEYLIMTSLKYLNKKYHHKIMKEFYITALKIYEGQQIDINFQKRNNIKIKEYINMVKYKTGSLIGLCFKIIFLLKNKEIKEISQLGEELGVLFQMNNDLDNIQNKKNKKYAEDIIKNKKTIIYIKALEYINKQEKKKLIQLYKQKNKRTKIKNIIFFFNKLDIIKKVNKYINDYKSIILNNFKKSSIDNKYKLLEVIKIIFNI